MKMLWMLIDIDSTHNFISSKMVVKLGCVMELVLELKVLAAIEEELKCSKVCKCFAWTVQG